MSISINSISHFCLFHKKNVSGFFYFRNLSGRIATHVPLPLKVRAEVSICKIRISDTCVYLAHSLQSFPVNCWNIKKARGSINRKGRGAKTHLMVFNLHRTTFFAWFWLHKLLAGNSEVLAAYRWFITFVDCGYKCVGIRHVYFTCRYPYAICQARAPTRRKYYKSFTFSTQLLSIINLT